MRSNNFNQTDVEQFYMAFIKDLVFCRSALKEFNQKIPIAFAAAQLNACKNPFNTLLPATPRKAK